jgi:hypothetical protein
MTTYTTEDQREAVEVFAGIVEDSGPGFGPWDHLTCQEADALANILRTFGQYDAAQSLTQDHGCGDDDPADLHHGMYLYTTERDTFPSGPNVVGVEARCARCGQTFNPADADDLTHGVDQEDQTTECGGQGYVVGAWGAHGRL